MVEPEKYFTKFLFPDLGLFQRAILQSGTALCPWALTKSPATYLKKLAEHLGCPLENSGEILRCLRDKSVRSLLSAQMHLAVGPYNFSLYIFTFTSARSFFLIHLAIGEGFFTFGAVSRVTGHSFGP